MARRLSALVLATVLIGAPVSGEICRAFCATQGANPVDPPGSHPHHVGTHDQSVHHQASAEPASLSMRAVQAGTHACGELVSVAAESRASVRASVESVVATTPTDVSLICVQTSLTSDVDSRHGPPGPVRSVAPLRI
jgi:hypothetical protein